MGTEKGEEIQAKNIENTQNKIREENCTNLEKSKIIKKQESSRTPSKQDQKRKP
jgi:hypothetical protein